MRQTYRRTSGRKTVPVTEVSYPDVMSFEKVGLFYPKLLRNQSPHQYVFRNFLRAYDDTYAEGYVKMEQGIITGLFLDTIIIEMVEDIDQLHRLFNQFSNPDEIEMKHRSEGPYSIRIWYD